MSSGHPETRKKILEATWKLMEDGSGHAVRMSDIARAAGISRQALYLHFDARADLLIATTRYMDEVMGVEGRLAPSRDAASGPDRLRAFVAFAGGHWPNVQGVARALLAMRDTDPEAAQAWQDRMDAMREGCQAAIDMLAAEHRLADGWTAETATDLLCMMLSFESWDQLTRHYGWSSDDYSRHLQRQAEQTFIKPSTA